MEMVNDIAIQVGMIVVTVLMYLYMNDIPRRITDKIRLRLNRANLQAKRHFVHGAQLLARARSPNTPPSDVLSLAKTAAEEADKALSLDPKDAGSHILKALALDLQGFRTSALDSLDAALSPLAVKSLSDEERGDALIKRAQLKIGLDKVGRVDSAVADLVEAVRVGSEKFRAYCLLGECYQMKEMKEEATKAYQEAIRIQPGSALAKDALDRLTSPWLCPFPLLSSVIAFSFHLLHPNLKSNELSITPWMSVFSFLLSAIPMSVIWNDYPFLKNPKSYWDVEYLQM